MCSTFIAPDNVIVSLAPHTQYYLHHYIIYTEYRLYTIILCVRTYYNNVTFKFNYNPANKFPPCPPINRHTND